MRGVAIALALLACGCALRAVVASIPMGAWLLALAAVIALAARAR